MTRKTKAPDVSFGVEIECALPYGGAYSAVIAALAAVGITAKSGSGDYSRWTIVGDGGTNDPGFRWFLMAMGLDKPTRDYWMAERAAYAAGLNEDVPAGDMSYCSGAKGQFDRARRAA